MTARAPADDSAFEPDCPLIDKIVSSSNVNERRLGLTPTLLVLHYTGLESFARSVDVLRDPVCEVSCHYVIDTDGSIVQMVPERFRAWHAGVSSWRGMSDLNSRSIGIEIQNPGHERGYPAFPDQQMAAVEALAGDIVARHGIQGRDVVGHSDIAPGRKIDPGEKFDWPRLHRAGIGHWVAPAPICDAPALVASDTDAIAATQADLAAYGYGIEATGRLDDWTRTVVTAFQRHFRPARVDGQIDRSTIDTLRRLLDCVPR